MKKLILSVFILCFAFGAQAQSIDLGIKVGANFAKISDASVDLSNKTGLLAGAFVSIGFNKWAIQPEILYSQQGAKTDLEDFDLDYVNIPIMFKYYIIGNVLNIQVGPQFGFLAHQSIKDQVDAKDYDLSGAVGAGVDLPFGLRISARYHFGFTDVANNIGKNNVVSVAVGYSFL